MVRSDQHPLAGNRAVAARSSASIHERSRTMPEDTTIDELRLCRKLSRTVVAENDGQRHVTALEHRIDIECTHYTSTGARYCVNYLGEVLIESTRDPEYEACRTLFGRRIVGTLVTYGPGSEVPCSKIDIEKGAKLTTIDNATKGPRTGNYRPRPNHVEPDERE